MSFTIVCNKCNTSQEFKEENEISQDNIEIGLDGYETIEGISYDSVRGVYLFCENDKCKHWIVLEI